MYQQRQYTLTLKAKQLSFSVINCKVKSGSIFIMFSNC